MSVMTNANDGGAEWAPASRRVTDDPRSAVCAHLADMRRFARRRVRDEALADDAVQDALLAALVALPSFGGQSSLRTWLFGILSHKIQDAFRRESRYLRLPGHGGEDAEVGSGPAEAAGRATGADDDPVDAVARKRFGASVIAAVDRLPVSLKEVFLMQAIEGRSTEAVCHDLGISEANCWVRLHRARKRLSTELRGHY